MSLALTVADPRLEMRALDAISRNDKGELETGARRIRVDAAELELAEGSEVEGVALEAIGGFDGADRSEGALGPFDLGHREGSLELDHGRRAQTKQRVIERDDAVPARLFEGTRHGVNRRDGGFDVVVGDLAAAGRKVDQVFALGQQALIPAAAVLLRERDQRAAGVQASRQARGMEAHEGAEGVCTGDSRRRMLEQEQDEADGLFAELGAHRSLAGAVVTLVEEQVESALNGEQASLKLVAGAQVEERLAAGERLLSSADALFDRSRGGQEGLRHLPGTKAAQDVQDEDDLSLFREARVATREHHPQLVVADGLGLEQAVEGGTDGPLALEQLADLGGERARGALAAQDVERAILGGGHQPRRGVVGHSAELPDLERAAEGVLHDVLRQREVVHSEHAGERGDHAPRFTPEQVFVERHGHYIFMIERTST